MRIPAPPMVTLSADGGVACWLRSKTVALADPAKAAIRAVVELPHEALTAAFSPRGSLCAVAGSRQVSLIRSASGSVVASAPTPGPLFRVAVAEDGDIAAVARLGEGHTSLCRWTGEGLRPEFAGTGHSLGASAPFTLLRADRPGRILLAGRKGRSAFEGGGERFMALVQDGPEGVRVEWNGDGLPFAADGLRYPGPDGRLLIYDAERAALAALPAEAGSPEIVADLHFGGMTAPAVSPNGTWAAWIGGGNVLRLASLSTDSIVGEAAVELLDAFPAVGVNDAGEVTLVSSERPARIRFQRFAEGVVELCGEVAAPDWEE